MRSVYRGIVKIMLMGIYMIDYTSYPVIVIQFPNASPERFNGILLFRSESNKIVVPTCRRYKF
jgi:hypothetical protein